MTTVNEPFVVVVVVVVVTVVVTCDTTHPIPPDDTITKKSRVEDNENCVWDYTFIPVCGRRKRRR